MLYSVACSRHSSSSVGLDDALVSWLRYEEGLTRFIAEVLRLVEHAGLHKPVAA